MAQLFQDLTISKKEFKIYALLSIKDEVVRYIGKTERSLDERLKGHFKDKNSNKKKQQWVSEEGKENIAIILLEGGMSNEDDALKREEELISIYRLAGCPLFNLSYKSRRANNSSKNNKRKFTDEEAISIRKEYASMSPVRGTSMKIIEILADKYKVGKNHMVHLIKGYYRYDNSKGVKILKKNIIPLNIIEKNYKLYSEFSRRSTERGNIVKALEEEYGVSNYYVYARFKKIGGRNAII